MELWSSCAKLGTLNLGSEFEVEKPKKKKRVNNEKSWKKERHCGRLGGTLNIEVGSQSSNFVVTEVGVWCSNFEDGTLSLVFFCSKFEDGTLKSGFKIGSHKKGHKREQKTKERGKKRQCVCVGEAEGGVGGRTLIMC